MSKKRCKILWVEEFVVRRQREGWRYRRGEKVEIQREWKECERKEMVELRCP